jgi:hypothetical protein
VPARGFGGDIHDPRTFGLIQDGKESPSQQPWCEVVDSNHLRVAVRGDPLPEGVQSGVVDEDADPGVVGCDLRADPAHIVGTGEVGQEDVNHSPRRGGLDRSAGSICSLSAAGGDCQAGTPLGELDRGNPSDAARRASDDDGGCCRHLGGSPGLGF